MVYKNLIHSYLVPYPDTIDTILSKITIWSFSSWVFHIVDIWDITVLYNCIYLCALCHSSQHQLLLHFVVFFLKKSVYSSKFSTWSYILDVFHVLSLWCTFWSPPFFYINLNFWVQTEFIFMLRYPPPSEQNFFLSWPIPHTTPIYSPSVNIYFLK